MARSNTIAPEDLEWEDPTPSRRQGVTDALATQAAAMRAALATRRGRWAILETYTAPGGAGYHAANLRRKADAGDSRLASLEFAGRRMLDGGSKLYVRMAPA